MLPSHTQRSAPNLRASADEEEDARTELTEDGTEFTEGGTEFTEEGTEVTEVLDGGKLGGRR